MARNNNQYKIVRHSGLLTCILYDLEVFSTTQQKWVTACASSFDADIKHYCQDVNAMDVYNDRKNWENRIHSS